MWEGDENTYLEDTPYSLQSKIEKALNKHDNFTCIVKFMKDVDPDIIRIHDLQDIESNPNRGGALLTLLFERNFTVGDLQELLECSDLFHIHRLMNTNVECKVLDPAEDVSEEVLFGKSHMLVVRVLGSPYPEGQWYHNDKILEGEAHWKLLIENFKHSDCGTYKCLIKQTLKGNEQEMWSPSFHLTMKPFEPTVIPGKDLKDVEVDAGEEVCLELGVAAEPKPTYIWGKDGRELWSSCDSTFRISNAGLSDSGKYFCKAINDIGSCFSKEIRVTVRPPVFAPETPKIIRQPEELKSCALGAVVIFNFCVTCKHDVTFSWNVNGFERENLDPLSSRANYYECNYIYKVTEEDWDQGKREQIVLTFTASSNGHRVSSQARINVNMKTGIKEQFKARSKFALLIANEDYVKELKTPVNDMKSLASKLIELGFHCMMCRNLTKPETKNIVKLFSSFLQNGDYVVFYYAGHGYLSKGMDLMIPIHTWQDVIQEENCITFTEIINEFNQHDPALLFVIHDACREINMDKENSSKINQLIIQHKEWPHGSGVCSCATKSINQLDNPFEYFSRIAKGNWYGIYATSESYQTFEEVQSGSSLLMAVLIQVIGDRIPVNKLGLKFQREFRHQQQIEGDAETRTQIPVVTSDLYYDRSLTDPKDPPHSDFETVLLRWENLSNLGGEKTVTVNIGDLLLDIKVKCEHDLPLAATSNCSRPSVISNCINVVININPKTASLTSLQEKDLTVLIEISSHGSKIVNKISNGSKIERKVNGETIEFLVTDLQTLLDNLNLTLNFMKNGTSIMYKCISIGTPSLCPIAE